MEQPADRMKISPVVKAALGWAEVLALEHHETPRRTTATQARRSPPSPGCPVPAGPGQELPGSWGAACSPTPTPPPSHFSGCRESQFYQMTMINSTSQRSHYQLLRSLNQADWPSNTQDRPPTWETSQETDWIICRTASHVTVKYFPLSSPPKFPLT